LRRKSLDLWLEERELRREALELSRPTACELAGAHVYILARNPELKLGAKLALEILRERNLQARGAERLESACPLRHPRR
jgi:hypothetical protein